MDHVIDHYSTQLINKLGMHGFEIYDEDLDDTFPIAGLEAHGIQDLFSKIY